MTIRIETIRHKWREDELMSLVGQLVKVARETLPQIAFEVSDLQQRFNVATVAELIEANGVLRKAKKLVATNILRFVPIKLESVTYISVTDASFAMQLGGASQMGLAVLMATSTILEGSDTASLLEWLSKKTHRVVKSTLAAEAAAMSYGFDRTFFAREVYTEITSGRSRRWKDISPSAPMIIQFT